jgi:hypothetical protein
MADQKSIGIAILGIAAVLAIIGLVLMFTTAIKSGAFSATLPKVYGGAIKDDPYPYLSDRTVSGVGGDQYAAQDNPQYMYYERGVRQIPSIQTACGKGEAQVSYNQMLGYETRDVECRPFAGGGYCCPVVGV